MANFGLSKPWMAQYHPETRKCSGAFKCGSAINTAVTPNSNTSPLYADNIQKENVSEFKNANVTLGVDKLPVKATEVAFGHKVSEDGTERSNANDSARYVSYCFITAEMDNGIKKYRACRLIKVQFAEGEESYETKGDSIVFKTPTLSGVAMADDTGEWRVKSPYFATEEEAENWIKVELGVVEKCETPVASVEGGEYASAQSVKLTCATEGATIKYTVDGTIPTETNGTTYSTAVQISANAGLRAIAYKESCEVSDVMFEEYRINAV